MNWHKNIQSFSLLFIIVMMMETWAQESETVNKKVRNNTIGLVVTEEGSILRGPGLELCHLILHGCFDFISNTTCLTFKRLHSLRVGRKIIMCNEEYHKNIYVRPLDFLQSL